MKGVIREIKYYGLLIFRDKARFLWTLAFPIFLATIFSLVFSGLMTRTEFEDIQIYIEVDNPR